MLYKCICYSASGMVCLPTTGRLTLRMYECQLCTEGNKRELGWLYKGGNLVSK